VDPIIAAALISAGATIVSVSATAFVAIRAYHTTWTTNAETIQAGVENTIRVLDGARNDRIWDKRAEAYVDALRYLHRTQTEREDMAHTGRYVHEAEQQLKPGEPACLRPNGGKSRRACWHTPLSQYLTLSRRRNKPSAASAKNSRTGSG
jgi:hypothetical protein